jgi:hypothetical protein
MRLGVRPSVFLARLLGVFFLTYFLWTPLAPFYTQLLAVLTQAFLHLTEISRDPNLNQATTMWVRGTGIFYVHRLFPQVHPPGIPAEWVQANLVLLIPLMLATPARSYGQRFGRLGLALGIALFLQVVDLTVTVKSFYASQLGTYSQYYYSSGARHVYQFADAFAESMDTQLFPFAIWAGIHFNQLLGRAGTVTPPAPARAATAPRQKTKAVKKAARAR